MERKMKRKLNRLSTVLGADFRKSFQFLREKGEKGQMTQYTAWCGAVSQISRS